MDPGNHWSRLADVRPSMSGRGSHYMTCNKIPFASRAEANAYLRLPERLGAGPTLHPYLCPQCGLWHLTSIPKKLSRAINRRIRKRG